MLSPSESRRSVRYPLHLPVTIKSGDTEISALSENISKGGILLSSDLLIGKGSPVELTVHFAPSIAMGSALKARGKILRVEPTVSGGFAMAIGCIVPFRITTPRSQT
jgi:PilZ domain-containing protein